MRSLVLALLVLAGLALAPVPAEAGFFQRTWGEDVVIGGGTGPEVCTDAQQCQGGTASGAGGSLFVPSGVATDAAGDVYVVGQAADRVDVFSADGAFKRAWGKDVVTGGGTGFEVCTTAASCKRGTAGSLGGELDQPKAIAVTPAGHVLVADSVNNRVQEFTKAGGFVRAFGLDVDSVATGALEECTVASRCKAGLVDARVPGSIYRPSTIAVDATGHLYVDAFRRIDVYDVDGPVAFQRAWGTDVVEGNAETGFEVCLAGGTCKTGEVGDGLGGQFGLASGLATDDDGDVYVFGANRFRIDRFAPDGTWKRAWGKDVVAGNPTIGFEVCTVASTCKTGVTGTTGGAFRSQNDLVAPTTVALAVDPDGDVYAADYYNDRLQQFTRDGAFVAAIGLGVLLEQFSPDTQFCTAKPDCGPGSQVSPPPGGAFAHPSGIGIGAGSTLFVTDQAAGRVQRLQCPASSFAFSAASSAAPEYAGPATVTVRRDGDTACPASVGYATAGGTATAADYTAVAGTLAFAPGQTTRTFQVPILDDEVNEGNETVGLALSAPTARATLGAPATATLTITDDDALNTQITGGPDGLTNDPQPSFRLASVPDGAAFECRVDGGAFAACSSPWQVPSRLADGEHVIEARATQGGVTDPSPARRTVNVDTTPPTTLIAIAPDPVRGVGYGGDRFGGRVTYALSQTDAAPGVVGQVYGCEVDPAREPLTFGDLPQGLCPGIVDAVGTHTIYAASLDRAGNPSAVVRRTFTILAEPDTTITAGPSGTTWRGDPVFTFAATIPGSTFRCRLDGGAERDCTTPFAPALTQGAHTLEVAARSPEVALDRTPARRAFTIARQETHDRDCAVAPFLPTTGSSRRGCGWGSTCPDRVACGPALPVCPAQAVCRIDLRATMSTPTDRITSLPNLAQPIRNFFGSWDAGAYVGFVRPIRCRAGTYTAALNHDPSTRNGCDARASAPFFGTGRPIGTYCAAQLLDSSSHPFSAYEPGDFGPDDERRLACAARLSITAATALEAIAAGTDVSLYAKQPGTASVVGDIPPGSHALVAAKRRPAAFKALKRKVAKAGPVKLVPRLSRLAKRRLARTGRLTVRLTVRFTPKKGKASRRTTTVVLTRPRNERAAQRAATRRWCRTHPKYRRTAACRRAARR